MLCGTLVALGTLVAFVSFIAIIAAVRDPPSSFQGIPYQVVPLLHLPRIAAPGKIWLFIGKSLLVHVTHFIVTVGIHCATAMMQAACIQASVCESDRESR